MRYLGVARNQMWADLTVAAPNLVPDDQMGSKPGLKVLKRPQPEVKGLSPVVETCSFMG